MTNANELQAAYVKLYRCMREYVWSFSTVELLAELEIAIYARFPDMDLVRSKFQALHLDIREQAKLDEELSEKIDALKELIDLEDSYYAELNSVREVYQ